MSKELLDKLSVAEDAVKSIQKDIDVMQASLEAKQHEVNEIRQQVFTDPSDVEFITMVKCKGGVLNKTMLDE